MAFSDSDIAAYVSANINNPQAIADAMQQHGVSAAQVSQATGYTPTQINDYFSNAGATTTAPVTQTATSTSAAPLSNTDISEYFAANKYNPANIVAAMQQHNVSAEKLAQATGYTPQQINAYLALTNKQPTTGGLNAVSGTNPAIGSLIGANVPGLDFGDAVYRFWQQNAVPQGSKDYNAWLQGAVGTPYMDSLQKISGLANSYYDGAYKTPQEEQQAWNNLIQQSGMSATDFNSMYGKYMQREQVTAPTPPITRPPITRPPITRPPITRPPPPITPPPSTTGTSDNTGGGTTGGLNQINYNSGNSLDLNALRPNVTNSVYNYHQGITNKLWGGQ